MCGVKIFVVMTLVVSLTLAMRMDPDRDVRKESERRRKDGETRTNVESKHQRGEFDSEKHQFFHANKEEVRSNDITVKKHLGERDLRRQPFRKANLTRTIDGALRNDLEAKNDRSAAEFAYHSVIEGNETPSKGKRVKNEDEVKRQEEEEVEYTENGCPTRGKFSEKDCFRGFRYSCEIYVDPNPNLCWSTKLSGEELTKHVVIPWEFWRTNLTGKPNVECETAADCLRHWKEQEEAVKEAERGGWVYRNNRERNHAWHPCFDDFLGRPCWRGHRYGCYKGIEPGFGFGYQDHCWVQSFVRNDVDMGFGYFGYQVLNGWREPTVACNTDADCGNYLREHGRPWWVDE